MNERVKAKCNKTIYIWSPRLYEAIFEAFRAAVGFLSIKKF